MIDIAVIQCYEEKKTFQDNKFQKKLLLQQQFFFRQIFLRNPSLNI